MMKPFLSLTTLCLGIITVSAEDAVLYSRRPRSTANHPSSYTLNLPVAECAFSYTECIGTLPSPPSSLSVTFSTQKDALLANNDTIFPASMPMEFHAQRSWPSSSESESVPIAYALDVQPLPHQPDADLGGLYRLTLTLVDLQGRPATESHITIGMLRHNNGDIEIIQVEESSWRRFHRHLALKSKNRKDSSWWATKKWKSLYVNLLHKTSPTWGDEDGHESQSEHAKDDEVYDHIDCGRDDRHHPHPHHHQSPSDWGRNRHYFKHLRPVLLPGLMGVIAGVVSCILGYLLGKVIIMIHCFLCRRSNNDDDYEAGVVEIGFSVSDEKQRLMERDAYTRSD